MINKPSWFFGHLAYDLKNEIEELSSLHTDLVQFPDFFFFEPEIVIQLNRNEMIIEGDEPEEIFAAIDSNRHKFPHVVETSINLQQRISKEEYCLIIDQLKQHILRGDCYEINFCQEFFAEECYD